MRLVSSALHTLGAAYQAAIEDNATQVVLVGIAASAALATLVIALHAFTPNLAVAVICSLLSMSGAASAGLSNKSIGVAGVIGLLGGYYFAPAIIAKEAAQRANPDRVIIFW